MWNMGKLIIFLITRKNGCGLQNYCAAYKSFQMVMLPTPIYTPRKRKVGVNFNKPG